MPIHVKRLSVIAGLGALLAMAGCDSNSSYDHRYDDYSYDRYPSSDRNSAYERGYRDGERASFNQNYNSRDYREGYDRGRKEAKRDSKERSRDRNDYRHSNDYRPPSDYRGAPGGVPPSAPGTFGTNDG